jgi:type IV pilus assembly protein PilA
MKRCPYCAEAIQDDTQVCPHCGMNLTANVYPPPPPQPVYQQPPPQSGLPGDAYSGSGQPPETSGKAMGSLIAGISAYVIAPFVGSIVAIVLGHIGLSEIKKSAGRLKGDGLAIAGLVLGYLQWAALPFVLIIAAIAIPNLLRAKMAANEASAVQSLRSYNYAVETYATQCPKIGFPHSLSNLSSSRGPADCDHAHLLDQSLATDLPVKSGYRFLYQPGPVNELAQIATFELRAEPITSGTTGVRYFFVDQTGVIRVKKDGHADEASEPLQ